MKKNIIIWSIAIILLVFAIVSTKFYESGKIKLADQIPKVTPVPSGNLVKTNNISAPNFTLKDLDGKQVSLDDFKGKSIYLNFWATWCPPCRKEMPEIEKMYKKYKDKGLVILAVDLGEDMETVKNFIAQNNYTFRVLLDSDQSVAKNFNISSIPVSYFINKDGKVISKRVGALSENEMESYIQELFK